MTQSTFSSTIRQFENRLSQKENFSLFCQMLIVAGGTGPDGNLASTEVI